MYLTSLNSKETARAVPRASPASLQDAMNTALDNYKVEDALQRLVHRQEKPMDTSTLASRPTSKPPSMDTLSRHFNKMSSKIAKMEAQMYHGRQKGGPRRNTTDLSRTPEGKSICYHCDTPGHIARYCPLWTYPRFFHQLRRIRETNRAVSLSRRPSLSLKIDSLDVEGLLDTISSLTLLAATIFFKLVKFQHRTPLLSPPSSLELQSVSGHRLNILKKTNHFQYH